MNRRRSTDEETVVGPRPAAIRRAPTVRAMHLPLYVAGVAVIMHAPAAPRCPATPSMRRVTSRRWRVDLTLGSARLADRILTPPARAARLCSNGPADTPDTPDPPG